MNDTELKQSVMISVICAILVESKLTTKEELKKLFDEVEKEIKEEQKQF